MFDGIESFEEAMTTFRREVVESEHVCGYVGGCKAVTVTSPFCRLLAISEMSLHIGKVSAEEFERLKTKPLEEWLQEALSRFERAFKARDHGPIPEVIIEID